MLCPCLRSQPTLGVAIKSIAFNACLRVASPPLAIQAQPLGLLDKRRAGELFYTRRKQLRFNAPDQGRCPAGIELFLVAIEDYGNAQVLFAVAIAEFIDEWNDPNRIERELIVGEALC